MLRILKHHQIDRKRWDAVVTDADHPYVYLLSWYLDVVSPQWEGLVWDDYRYIFPLPQKRKWGIPYLVQPDFCQKLGITGIGVKKETARLFYKKLFWRYPYYHLQIDYSTGLEKRKSLTGRINYTLDLSPAYERLRKDYHPQTLKNLKKCVQEEFVVRSANLEEYCHFLRIHQKGLDREGKEQLCCLVNAAQQNIQTILLKVCQPDGTILAAACFLVWNMQILYLAGCNAPEGRKEGVMYLLMDRMIRDYAETGYLLDMEGSMIPGVARFFRNMGARSFYYYQLKKYLCFYR